MIQKKDTCSHGTSQHANSTRWPTLCSRKSAGQMRKMGGTSIAAYQKDPKTCQVNSNKGESIKKTDNHIACCLS